MAADDPGERERLAGLIKLAAAFVHAARGNPPGVTTNLRGARERLVRADAAGADGGLDLAALVVAIDTLLAEVAALPTRPSRPAAAGPARPGRPRPSRCPARPMTSPARPVGSGARGFSSSRP